MSDLVKGLKTVWMKGMEAIGDTASNIANNTKYKVQEMNLINRRHEILEDFGAQAYALWQQGEQFPAELQKQLEELSKVDETLNTIRAERLAYLQTVEEEKAANRAASEDFKPDEEQEGEAPSQPEDAQPAEDAADEPDEEPAEACAEESDEGEETPCEAECHDAPVMETPTEDCGDTADDASEADTVPTLEVPDADEAAKPEAAPAEPFDDPIEELMRQQAPAVSKPVKPATAAQKRDFEKKVGRAIDTVQDKMTKLGRVIDRSVQNLAKVVLQNEEKQDKPQDDSQNKDA